MTLYRRDTSKVYRNFFFTCFSMDTFLRHRCSAPIFWPVFHLLTVLAALLPFSRCQPLHIFSPVVGNRDPWALSCCISGKQSTTLSVSVYKNGQLFPNRFSGKRIIPQPCMFEKIYLVSLSSWRHKIHYHKNYVSPLSAWPWGTFFL